MADRGRDMDAAIARARIKRIHPYAKCNQVGLCTFRRRRGQRKYTWPHTQNLWLRPCKNTRAAEQLSIDVKLVRRIDQGRARQGKWGALVAIDGNFHPIPRVAGVLRMATLVPSRYIARQSDVAVMRARCGREIDGFPRAVIEIRQGPTTI